jgi:glycosyltransferase involved in cell wall biosynthesis
MLHNLSKEVINMVNPKIKDLVSVIISCYNVESYIVECLDNTQNQTYQNIEVIIINDCSNDGTTRVINNWINKNKPKFQIEFINLPRNIGFAGVLNLGYYLAKGEFIAVHDADDISHHQRLEKQVNFLRNNQQIGLVGTNYAAFRDGDFQKQQKANWIRYGENIRKVYEKGGHCVCHGTIMIRSEIFDRIGGPTRRIAGAEDYEFIAKCIQSNIGVDNIPEILYFYRSHPNQRSRQFYSKERKKND